MPNILPKKHLTILMLVLTLAPEILQISEAIASTTTSTDALSDAHKQVSDLVGGSFAKIISLIAIAFGLVGCAVRFNTAAIASAFGVGIAAGVGPKAVETVLGAII